MWRNDGKCGGFNRLPDGRGAECDPDGDKPCCSNNVWGGVCGQDCYCVFCKDYKLLKEWRESNGTKKWRYDGKCGIHYLLPDGTPAQCDPEGEKPCCSDINRGECGNTTEHCDCGNENIGGSIWKECFDYRPIYNAWKKSGGKQRWSQDGRCGKKIRLPDGAPMECDPDSKRPCCDHWDDKCRGTLRACMCTDCVDYRLVRTVRESGKTCAVARLESGYLKYACFDEKSHRQHFKCTNSDVTYKLDNHGLGELRNVTASCDNDPHAYQACGLGTKVTQSDVLCGGYFCKQKRNQRHNFIECTGDRCKTEYRDFIASDDNTEATNCDDNDICDSGGNCKLDEGNCNGYIYGFKCPWRGGDFLPLSRVCDGNEDCYDSYDEKGCRKSTTKAVNTCNRFNEKIEISALNSINKCSMSGLKKYDIIVYVEPFCGDYSDHTNCSEINRVGGYCKINNFLASVSKYVVCRDIDQFERLGTPVKLCGDNFHNNCISPHPACKIHKHKMCDGIEDCIDRSDEIHDMCQTMTEQFKCTRRFRFRLGEFKIPVSWIMDNEIDCLDGEDENASRWHDYFCKGEFKIFTKPGKPCKDVYKCPGDAKSYVPLEQLCDGVESCGDGAENAVCKIARDFPVIMKNASYNGTIRILCDSSNYVCSVEEFQRPWGSVFGEQKIELLVPESKVNCSKLYGENYLFLSCMNLCKERNANCLLDDENRKLEYNSCPGQYFNRSYTLANNSYLTFVDKSDSGQYHQDFYRCNNGQCVEYKQVCDLVDDCGDTSDEKNCVNHMICENTLNSSKLHFISQSQRCDGIYDCFDLSDECNESCSRHILGNWIIKCACWFMGLLALAFNVFSLFKGILSLRRMVGKTSSLFVLLNRTLVSLICYGDFLMRIFLVVLSVYDSVILGDSYCRQEAQWFTGTACLILGVLSTVGSQISVFAMTVLSVIRAAAIIRKSMTYPIRIGSKAGFYASAISLVIISISVGVAFIPLLPPLEDYFVQGMYYDPAYKLFVGFPNKERHIQVLKTYYKNNTSKMSSDPSWREIRELVDGMFTQDYGKLARLPVHFYGNDGVCLFKYFVRTDDARRSRNSPGSVSDMYDPVVWTILVVNLACFVVMSLSYIVLLIYRKAQPVISSTRNTRWKLQTKVTIILVTDFLCWVPLILVSILHNLSKIDASSWYVPFTMVLLPLNSVINPLIYENSIMNFLERICRLVWAGLLAVGEMVTRRLRTRNLRGTEIDEYELDVFRQNF